MAQRTRVSSATLDRQTMEDLLVTALEGGSNYWYFLPDSLALSHALAANRGEPGSIKIFRAVMDVDAHIPVTDKEDQYLADHADPPRKVEPLGYISREGMESALDKMLDPEGGNRRQAALIISGDWDSDAADVWFQFALMDKQVYG